jgi:ribulose-phosphate 3-epimerase
MKVAVSFLSSKRTTGQTIDMINKSSADFIHVDLMDGKFVENKNIGARMWKYLQYCEKPLDVHFMVKNPLKYVDHFKGLNVRIIYINYNSYFLNDLEQIRKKGFRVGLVINPWDDLELMKKYYPYVDKILVMSVIPGAGGQSFMMETIDKLKQIVKYRKEANLNFTINIDGGINEDTAKLVKNYVDDLVSGSYVCKADDPEKQIEKLKK